MTKNRRGYLKVIFALLFFVLGILLCHFWQGNDNTEKRPTSVEPDVILTEEQSKQAEISAADFEDINSAVATKDYSKIIALAKTYGQNTKNEVALRLTAYGQCITASLALSQTTDREECYEKATILVNQIKDEDTKNGWIGVLENIYLDKQPDFNASGGEDELR